MWVFQLPPRRSMAETCLLVAASGIPFPLEQMVSAGPMPSCHNGLLIGLSSLRFFILQPVVMWLVGGAGILLLG